MIDSRIPESIDLAENLICEAPEECQVVVFSNFIGEPDVSPVIPEKLRQYIGKFSFIPGSLKTNLGLTDLAKWLELPLLAAKRKMYADLFRATDEDLHTIEDIFIDDAKNYLTIESARAKLPVYNSNVINPSKVNSHGQNNAENNQSNISISEPPPSLQRPSIFAEPIPKKPMPFCNNTDQQPAPKKSITDLMNSQNDDDFWGDEEDEEEEKVIVVVSDVSTTNPLVQNVPKKQSLTEIRQPNQTTTNTNNISYGNTNSTSYDNTTDKVDNENDFWSDEENNDDLKNTEKINENEELKPNPLVQNLPKTNEQNRILLQPQNIQSLYQKDKIEIQNSSIQKKEIETKVENDEDFWSDDQNDKAIQNPNSPQINVNDHKEQRNEIQKNESLKPNPLVQKVQQKPTNPYQNIVPKQTTKIVESVDDDDFWKVETPVISQNILKKRAMKKHSTTSSSMVSHLDSEPASVAKNNSQIKQRPEVIPKSQVLPRTITTKSETNPQQQPRIPTTNLFPDLDQDGFEITNSSINSTQQQTTPNLQQHNPNQGKTVRKRKKVIKNKSTGVKTQISSSNYDSI
ncbi:hypothetical protein TRFO_39463 [Tritrichomonas foetus]|uniref:Uncharacterized protein n=1 Tax=Tritrichomonas foetus TaxID=1144522 RepID=A0A1J4J6M6_9EUKA|nr:hypothetical protein TRFO_39463 [Tritrichomonas foetus]|eukprot:OHS94305.1 hypothetical protein TRFO_39463 [Tritrichomonas foetus]